MSEDFKISETTIRPSAAIENLENFNPDPNGVIFVPKGYEGEERYVLRDASERQRYEDELKTSVFRALELGLGQGNTREIYEQIVESRLHNPESSLFLEIQARLEDLAEDPDNFKVDGKNLTKDEEEQVKKTLKLARGIIVEAARDAGVFEPLDELIDRIQENPNYERAVADLYELRAQISMRNDWVSRETKLLNRSSRDFAGISVSYINARIQQMEFGLILAENQLMEEKVGSLKGSKNKYERHKIRKALEIQDELVNATRKIIGDKSIADPEPELIKKARIHLQRKERGILSEGDLPAEGGSYTSATGDNIAEILRKISEEATRTREAAETQAEEAKKLTSLEGQQYELWKRGFSGIVSAVANRTRVNPEQFDQTNPLWYERLGREEQGMIRTMLHINYLATITRDYGMTNLDAWTNTPGLRIERDDLKNMWDKLPGFRMALATMSHDLFEQSTDENPIDHFVLSQTGYEILQDYKVLQDYKDGLIKIITEELKKDPNAAVIADKFGLKDEIAVDQNGNEIKDEHGNPIITSSRFEMLAKLAVNNADNLLFSTGAYVSADEKRPYEHKGWIKLADDNIAPDAIKTFFQPGRKLMEQATEPRGGAGAEPGQVERAPLGPIGEWMTWNIQHTPGFKEKVMSGEIQYLPSRLYYSLLDQTDVTVIENGTEKKYSIAEMLVKNDGKKVQIGGEVDINSRGIDRKEKQRSVKLYDFAGGADYIDIGTVVASNLLGDYGDERSSAQALYRHLTSDDPKDRLSPNKFINNLAKVRKHRKLRPIYNDPSYLKSAIGMLISPERGFIKGTDQLLPDIDRDNYSSLINYFLSDDRLYTGAIKRSELLKAFNSRDTYTFLGLLAAIHIDTLPVSSISRKRRKAKKRIEEILRETERTPTP